MQDIDFTLVFHNNLFFFDETLDLLQLGSAKFKKLVCLLNLSAKHGFGPRTLVVASVLVLKIIETSWLQNRRLSFVLLQVLESVTLTFEGLMDRLTEVGCANSIRRATGVVQIGSDGESLTAKKRDFPG